MTGQTEKGAMRSLERIVALQFVADQKKLELDLAETSVKSLRREHDKALDIIQVAIREEAEPSLFSTGIPVTAEQVEEARAEVAKEEDDPKPEKKAKKQKVDELVFDVPHDGLWRGCHIEFLGASAMSPDLIKAFEEHTTPVKSLGDLMSYINKDGCKLTDVPGTTKARAKRIEDALYQFVRQSEEKVGAAK